MMKKIFLILAVFAAACAFGEDRLAVLISEHPVRIEKLFAHLDLDFQGLEKVKAAVRRGDTLSACRHLLAYYDQTVAKGGWVRRSPIAGMEYMEFSADDVLKDAFTFQNEKAVVPRDKNGLLDWNYTPNGSYHWTNPFNRHFHLGILMQAWQETGNPAYARRVNADFRDWILTRPYGGKAYKPNESDEHQWSLLETGTRCDAWSKVFYGMYAALDDDVKIMILSSVPDHLHCVRHFHSKGGNHLAIEIRGLATMAGAFREFRESKLILDYAAEVMTASLMDQVYPDGVQKELTAHYHGVAYRAFAAFAAVYEGIGQPLPQPFLDRVALMLDYTAYAQRPNGCGPMNNDSDLVFIRKNTLAVQNAAGRDDWKYINSNGKEGNPPEKKSVFYPWAGQAIMRSGWDESAHWSFFDVGPWGIGHKHADKLHLSITAYGRDLLVDAGRYTYDGYNGGPEFPWRDYFITSISHNVVLIDGAGQNPKVSKVDKPLENAFVTTPDYDFCRGTYNEPYKGIDDNISHTRAVLYLRDRCWFVVDRLQSAKPHQVQFLWHYHPDCMVELDGSSVISTDIGKANLRITPVFSNVWKTDLKRGQEDPVIQGWYSPEMNVKLPGTAAVYETEFDQSMICAWILTVDPSAAPDQPDVQILSESLDQVRLSVEPASGGKWMLEIPLSDDVRAVSVENKTSFRWWPF